MEIKLKTLVMLVMSAIISQGICAANINETKKIPGWKLYWQDEFNKPELDESIWSLCKKGKSDWDDTMSEDPRLLQIKDGILKLEGIENKKKTEDETSYLTAGIKSKKKFTFQYGKIQIRARFKSAQGAWPALWMLGENGKWPANGEIDLMEHLNFENMVHQTIHSTYTHKIDKTNTPTKSTKTNIKRDDWNTYGCEWDKDKIVFTVNGKHTLTYPKMAQKHPEQWPFDQPFYLVFSMQIGGIWVNSSGPTNPKQYPANMEVDWVRIYKKDQ